jgi:amino acid transporter
VECPKRFKNQLTDNEPGLKLLIQMKKIVLIFGLIIGTILCANMIVMVNMMYSSTGFKGNDVVGYAAMVVLFSLIFVGVKNYRDKQLDGTISFGQAFKTGSLIALTGAAMYVVVWLFYYYLFVPDFIDVYTRHVLTNCTPTDLPAKTKEMADLKEMYKNPIFVILITFAEVLPVGLAVAFVSALILKRRHVPAT